LNLKQKAVQKWQSVYNKNAAQRNSTRADVSVSFGRPWKKQVYAPYGHY